MKYSGIGGQAVIEGIMMRNGSDYATAVRKPDGGISVKKEVYTSLLAKYPVLRLMFIRGIFAFADSMTIGMRSLSYSASFFEDDEDSEPSKLELFLDKIFGKQAETVIMAAGTAFSILAAVGMFLLLPAFLGGLIRKVYGNYYIAAFLEGVIRIAIFVLYIKLISRFEDIRRTFMYHGAEHKCINCVENGLELTVENVMKSSREHKRCGTSFIIIVMLISIVFFMAIKVDTVALRILTRVLLIPVIAGVSFEFLSLAGRSDAWLVNILSRPGMWMQALTVKEPTSDMVEVAISAVEAVFDWKKYLRENFGKEI